MASVSRTLVVGVLVTALSACGRPASPRAASPVPEASPTSSSSPDAQPTPTRTAVTLPLNEPITLDDETFTLQSFTIEEIEADPNGSAAYPGGAGLTLSIDTPAATIDLSDVPAAYEPTKVGWSSLHRVELVGYDTRKPSVEVYIDRISGRVASSAKRVRIERGKEIALGPTTMRFDGHSHKSVMEGQTSPLIVRVTYDPQSRHPEEASYNLEVEHRAWWRWHDYELTLGPYEYDRFMELTITRLALEAIER